MPKEGEESISLLDLQLILHGFYLNSLSISDSENKHTQKNHLELDSENFSNQNNNYNVNDNQNNEKNEKHKSKKLNTFSALAAVKRKSENTYTKSYYFIDSSSEKIIERIPVAIWKSTTIMTQLLKDTLEDLINDNGIVYKTMINAYIESKEKEKLSALIKDENIKETNQREEIKNDPIVALIGKLESCKNRIERKRLLAEFNKTVGFGWGEYRKIPKFEENDFDKNYEDDLNNDNEDLNNNSDNNRNSKNGNNNEKEIYRQIADENKSKNSNNYNTIVFSEKKIKKIYSDTQKVNLIGSKFTQKINVKNQKIKALENQKKLSLMLNDESADRTYVKIPGKDYDKAINYIGEDKEKIENFASLIEAKKKDYSVDLRNYVKSKHGKTDMLLDQSKKITLLQLEKLEERKMLEKDILNSESAMLEFEMKVGKNNLLESKFVNRINDNGNNYNDNKNLDYENGSLQSNFERKGIRKFNKNGDSNYAKDLMVIEDDYENNLALASNGERKTYDLSSIQFKKLNLQRNKNQKGFENKSSNIALYKQENELTKNTIKVKQDKAKIKKVLNNKHVYQSMNYYKNNDLEHLAYERDPDVMNALKFRKAIKKDKYYYDRDSQLHNKNSNDKNQNNLE